MKILEKEIALREETRTLEQARPALDLDDYGGRARPLAGTQDRVAELVVKATGKIRKLPQGASQFRGEIALLVRVEQVMREAHELLTRPETGSPTIAAETEAIELLLQARRQSGGGGGGGSGGSSPGGGGAGDGAESALALLGRGNARNTTGEARTVEQATGVTGTHFPDEYRAGLDAYFNAYEGRKGGGQ
jgi:hypothetical protein